MEAPNGVNLLNKVLFPVKCISIDEALQKLNWTDATYMDSESGGFEKCDISNHCDLIYDIQPPTQIGFDVYDSHGILKRRIRLNTVQFTAQNPLVRCACPYVSINTEIPVKYKALYIGDSIRNKLCEHPFQIGNLIYVDGKVVENTPINPIL